jgi:hypothetical protein
MKDGGFMETNSEYKDYYNSMLEESKKFTDFLTVELAKRGLILQMFSSKEFQIKHGESNSKIEVKYDRLMKKPPHNLYIETHEKANPNNENYVESGVFRQDNTILWAHGDYSTVYIFCKNGLKKLIENCREVKTQTSVGKLLPHDTAERYCALKIRFNDTAIPDFEIKKENFIRILEERKPDRKEKSLFSFK